MCFNFNNLCFLAHSSSAISSALTQNLHSSSSQSQHRYVPSSTTPTSKTVYGSALLNGTIQNTSSSANTHHYVIQQHQPKQQQHYHHQSQSGQTVQQQTVVTFNYLKYILLYSLSSGHPGWTASYCCERHHRLYSGQCANHHSTAWLYRSPATTPNSVAYSTSTTICPCTAAKWAFSSSISSIPFFLIPAISSHHCCIFCSSAAYPRTTITHFLDTSTTDSG